MHPPPALQRAVKLARLNEARLLVVNVTREIPRMLVNLQETFFRLQMKQLETLIKQVVDCSVLAVMPDAFSTPVEVWMTSKGRTGRS